MKIVFLIFYAIILTSLLIYKTTIINFIRATDLKVYNYLVEKNTSFGLYYNNLKLFLFILGAFHFVYVSLHFFLDYCRLEGDQVILAFFITFLPFMGIIYWVYLLILQIQERKFVFIDEIFQIVICGYLVALLYLLQDELCLVPSKILKKAFFKKYDDNFPTSKPPSNSNIIPSPFESKRGSGSVPESIPEAPSRSRVSLLGEARKGIANLIITCREKIGNRTPDCPEEMSDVLTGNTTTKGWLNALPAGTAKNQMCGVLGWTYEKLWGTLPKDRYKYIFDKDDIVVPKSPRNPFDNP